MAKLAFQQYVPDLASACDADSGNATAPSFQRQELNPLSLFEYGETTMRAMLNQGVKIHQVSQSGARKSQGRGCVVLWVRNYSHREMMLTKVSMVTPMFMTEYAAQRLFPTRPVLHQHIRTHDPETHTVVVVLFADGMYSENAEEWMIHDRVVLEHTRRALWKGVPGPIACTISTHGLMAKGNGEDVVFEERCPTATERETRLYYAWPHDTLNAQARAAITNEAESFSSCLAPFGDAT